MVRFEDPNGAVSFETRRFKSPSEAILAILQKSVFTVEYFLGQQYISAMRHLISYLKPISLVSFLLFITFSLNFSSFAENQTEESEGDGDCEATLSVNQDELLYIEPISFRNNSGRLEIWVPEMYSVPRTFGLSEESLSRLRRDREILIPLSQPKFKNTHQFMSTEPSVQKFKDPTTGEVLDFEIEITKIEKSSKSNPYSRAIHEVNLFYLDKNGGWLDKVQLLSHLDVNANGTLLKYYYIAVYLILDESGNIQITLRGVDDFGTDWALRKPVFFDLSYSLGEPGFEFQRVSP